MFVQHENQKLYLKPWEYNACRIMSALANVVAEKGGVVDYTYQRTALICDASAFDEAREKQSQLDQMKGMAKSSPEYREKFAERMSQLEKDLEELQKIKEVFIPCEFQLSLAFSYNNKIYHYSFDQNPFFEFHYGKTPIVNGKYSMDAVYDEAPKGWFVDELYRRNFPEEKIQEIAHTIFDFLEQAPDNTIRLDSKKVRVPNRYNDGYHMETVYDKERLSDKLPQPKEPAPDL